MADKIPGAEKQAGDLGHEEGDEMKSTSWCLPSGKEEAWGSAMWKKHLALEDFRAKWPGVGYVHVDLPDLGGGPRGFWREDPPANPGIETGTGAKEG